MRIFFHFKFQNPTYCIWYGDRIAEYLVLKFPEFCNFKSLMTLNNRNLFIVNLHISCFVKISFNIPYLTVFVSLDICFYSQNWWKKNMTYWVNIIKAAEDLNNRLSTKLEFINSWHHQWIHFNDLIEAKSNVEAKNVKCIEIMGFIWNEGCKLVHEWNQSRYHQQGGIKFINASIKT